MWMMLQQDKPEDFIVATGVAYSVSEFLEMSFSMLNLDYRDFVEFDTRYTRPSEVDHLLGDPSNAKKKLGWEPEVNLPSLIKMMVEHDLELARREKYALGYSTVSRRLETHDRQGAADDVVDARFSTKALERAVVPLCRKGTRVVDRVIAAELEVRPTFGNGPRGVPQRATSRVSSGDRPGASESPRSVRHRLLS